MWVERVDYDIDWRKFKRGASFFIPCLNPKLARREILGFVGKFKIKVFTKVVIVDGIQGLRVWRM